MWAHILDSSKVQSQVVLCDSSLTVDIPGQKEVAMSTKSQKIFTEYLLLIYFKCHLLRTGFVSGLLTAWLVVIMLAV